MTWVESCTLLFHQPWLENLRFFFGKIIELWLDKNYQPWSMKIHTNYGYPLVMTNIAIENGDLVRGFSH